LTLHGRTRCAKREHALGIAKRHNLTRAKPRKTGEKRAINGPAADWRSTESGAIPSLPFGVKYPVTGYFTGNSRAPRLGSGRFIRATLWTASLSLRSDDDLESPDQGISKARAGKLTKAPIPRLGPPLAPVASAPHWTLPSAGRVLPGCVACSAARRYSRYRVAWSQRATATSHLRLRIGRNRSHAISPSPASSPQLPETGPSRPPASGRPPGG
jgi:hypothetical protein